MFLPLSLILFCKISISWILPFWFSILRLKGSNPWSHMNESCIFNMIASPLIYWSFSTFHPNTRMQNRKSLQNCIFNNEVSSVLFYYQPCFLIFPFEKLIKACCPEFSPVSFSDFQIPVKKTKNRCMQLFAQVTINSTESMCSFTWNYQNTIIAFCANLSWKFTIKAPANVNFSI